MGLDMYAMTIPANLIGDQQVDIDLEPHREVMNGDFAYWRKFNSLHGWMEKLYITKGGKSTSFNCDNVRLMPEDLDKLEQDAKAKTLTPTAGFFFGSAEPFGDDARDNVLEFIKRAREAINDGMAVIYDSWW